MTTEFQPETQAESPTPSLVALKAKVKKFRWTTFALVVLFFVLPFVQVSCQQQKLMTFTGFQMAFGTEIHEPQMFGPSRTRQVSGEVTILLAFFAALAGLGCSFLRGKAGNLSTAICGSVGFLLLLVFKVRLDNEVLKQSGGVLSVEYLFGFGASCLSFLASAVLGGYFFYTERNDNTVQYAATNTTERIDNLKSSATGLAQESRQWFIRKDVFGWMRRHAVVLGGVGATTLLLLIAYYAFIKPSPSADGKRAALAYTDCQTKYSAKVDSTYQSFLTGFAGQNHQTRTSANQKLESLLTGERKGYDTCNQAADKLYNELTERYTDDPDELAEFSKMFADNAGGSKSAHEIEQASSLLVTVNEKSSSIRSPFPESSRIAKDLIGKSMDGWNFSYASEFKDVKIISQNPDGDLLIQRIHLSLEDAITKEPYFAALDLKYNLSANGEWDYDGFTQLVYDKADTNYFVGDELFLVGKWRWQANEATYNPNGTWFGKQDNGGELSGTWRIVKGNLVLNLNGRSWVNKKIVQFSKNELIIDETSPARAERIE